MPIKIKNLTNSRLAENKAYLSTRPQISGATGELTWTLSGADAALFTVDARTGVVSMQARNFEAPTDAGRNNIYNYSLHVQDALGHSAQKNVAVTVADVREVAAIRFTSIAPQRVAENHEYLSATPRALGGIGAITWSLTGTDAELFSINARTGVVSLSARNFEAPSDADANNVYNYTLHATDADGNHAQRNVALTVTDVREVSTLNISGISNSSINENSDYRSNAPSVSGAIGDVTWRIVGKDAQLFNVDARTGVVSLSARDFETPADHGGNNVYNYTLRAIDADGNQASKAVAVRVLDVEETPNTPLTVTHFQPSDAPAISVAQNVVVEFSAAIQRGNGTLIISDGNGDTRTLSMDSADIQLDGQRLIIDLQEDLRAESRYSITLSDGALLDAEGNRNEAFSDQFQTGRTLYASTQAGNNRSTGNGTLENPYQSVGYASTQAQAGDTIYLLDPADTVARSYTLAAQGSAEAPIYLKPAPNASGLYSFTGLNAWVVSGAQHLVIEGFEFTGNSEKTAYWDLVSSGYWQPTQTSTAGGTAINVASGDFISIQNNYFHDLFQKAVNIQGGRYVDVTGNIIHDVATQSLSGGHGIMRQQGDWSNFGTADEASEYRWDISGNLLFNVEQRIYSWVPAKGYLNMTLDEGKAILIDETTDTQLSARISNNIVAFGEIDAIRLKPTANLEVSNNSIYATSTQADGITDVNTLSRPDPFPNLQVQNNLVQVSAQATALELNDQLSGSVLNNWVAGGGAINTTLTQTGVNASELTSAFVAPESGNFAAQAGIPDGVGVSAKTLADLNEKIVDWGVNVQDSGWHAEHIRLTQTLLDNIPGIHDGNTHDGSVFTSEGIWGDSTKETGRKAFYFEVNPTWQAAVGLTDAALDRTGTAYDGLYEIIVAEDYSNWHDELAASYSNASQIRSGNTVLAHDQQLQDQGLLVFELQNESTFDQTLIQTNTRVTLDGTLLLRFGADYQLSGASDEFDLMLGGTISSANSDGSLFNQITLVGLPDTLSYALNVQHGNHDSLHLSIFQAG